MSDKTKNVTVSAGFPLGALVAGALSYHINSSIGYAILHLFCGWFYVIYALIAHTDKLFGGG
jgi:hypothetical protein